MVNLRRLILLAIVAGCIVLVLLSLAGFWQRGTSTTDRPGEPVPPPHASVPGKPAVELAKEKGIEFTGLTMPHYSDNRKVADLYLPYGKEIPKTNKLLAENGTLTIYREQKDEQGNPRTLVVRFERAEVNKLDRSAVLEGEVDVQLQEGIHLKTTRVSWDPVKNLASTDAPVAITGKGIAVYGVGMEANVKTETAVLKRDVKVSIQSGGGLIFSKASEKDKSGKAKGPPAQTKTEKDREILIVCDGELTAKQSPVSAVFTRNVRVTASSPSAGGEPTFLNCDELEIAFASKKVTPDALSEGKGREQLKEKESLLLSGTQGPGGVRFVTARGHVTFKDASQEGAGDEMVWDAAQRRATLKGKNARFQQGNNIISANHMIYDQSQNTLTVPSGGTLTLRTKGTLLSKGTPALKATKPLLAKDQQTATPPLTVTWGKDLIYKRDRVVFHDRVKAQQGDSWIAADVLEVGFDDQNRVQSILATGPVALHHEGRQAFGHRLEWSANEGVAWLSGDPRAEIREADSFIGAPKIGFFRDQQRVECLGEGYILAVPNKGAAKGDIGATRSQARKQPALPILPGQPMVKGKGTDKIRITWAERMVFEQAIHTASFYKDVQAGKDDFKIAADELKVVFDETNKKITKISAYDPGGRLKILHPQGTGTGTEAEWHAADETASLFGRPRACVDLERGRRLEAPKIFVDTRDQALHTEGGGFFTSPAPKSKDRKRSNLNLDHDSMSAAFAEDITITWTQTLDFRKDSQEATFKGGVCARSGQKELEADALTVQFAETEAKKTTLKRLLAFGNVRLRQDSQQEGTGDRFTWDAAEDAATLEGTPACARGRMGSQAYYIQGPLIKLLKIHQPKQDILVNGKGLLRFSQPTVSGFFTNGENSDEITISWQDSMYFERGALKGACYGNTQTTKGSRTVKARRLEIHLDAEEQIDKVMAIGDLHVFDAVQQQEATGERLEWYKSGDKAVLVGAPDATIWIGSKGKGDEAVRTRTRAERIIFSGFFMTPGKNIPAAERQSQVKCEGRVQFAVEEE